MTKITKDFVTECVLASMSFFEQEIVDAVWERYKDKVDLPVTDLQAVAQQLTDYTQEAMREVLLGS